MPHETEAVSAQVLCTPYNHAPCHFMQSHIRKVYACLAVTCHLHFWQNDWDLLRATAVTRGWNGYRNKSQYRKLTMDKKILPPLQQGFEPATFQSRVRRSNHWAIPVPDGIAPSAFFGRLGKTQFFSLGEARQTRPVHNLRPCFENKNKTTTNKKPQSNAHVYLS